MKGRSGFCSVRCRFAGVHAPCYLGRQKKSHHDDPSSHHRTTKRNRSNSKKDRFLRSHERLGAHHHHCIAVVSAVNKRRQPQCTGTCPQNACPISAHRNMQTLSFTLYDGEDSIAQDWRSVPTGDLSRPLPKTASLVVKKEFSRYSRARVARWHLAA